MKSSRRRTTGGCETAKVELLRTQSDYHKATAAELLATPAALLTRSHLRELGFERRTVDAIFRNVPIVALPGYSRPMLRLEDYAAFIEEHIYRDDRVRLAALRSGESGSRNRA